MCKSFPGITARKHGLFILAVVCESEYSPDLATRLSANQTRQVGTKILLGSPWIRGGHVSDSARLEKAQLKTSAIHTRGRHIQTEDLYNTVKPKLISIIHTHILILCFRWVVHWAQVLTSTHYFTQEMESVYFTQDEPNVEKCWLTFISFPLILNFHYLFWTYD